MLQKNNTNLSENSIPNQNEIFMNDHKFENNSYDNNKIIHEDENNQEDKNITENMEELSLNESVKGYNKNHDRVLTTSELIISLIRYPITNLKSDEKNHLIEVIDEVIKKHNFTLPLKSKINHWKTKPTHAQFIIDCCGHILNVRRRNIFKYIYIFYFFFIIKIEEY